MQPDADESRIRHLRNAPPKTHDAPLDLSIDIQSCHLQTNALQKKSTAWARESLAAAHGAELQQKNAGLVRPHTNVKLSHLEGPAIAPAGRSMVAAADRVHVAGVDGHPHHLHPHAERHSPEPQSQSDSHEASSSHGRDSRYHAVSRRRSFAVDPCCAKISASNQKKF